jgi:hypothetical protein
MDSANFFPLQVDEASAEVKKFVQKVAYCQQEHPWLLLISTPKILLLSDILSQPQPSVFRIVCEIVHITSAKWEDMESEIEVTDVYYYFL